MRCWKAASRPSWGSGRPASPERSPTRRPCPCRCRPSPRWRRPSSSRGRPIVRYPADGPPGDGHRGRFAVSPDSRAARPDFDRAQLNSGRHTKLLAALDVACNRADATAPLGVSEIFAGRPTKSGAERDGRADSACPECHGRLCRLGAGAVFAGATIVADKRICVPLVLR
jgi:hypothetical protein